MPSLICDDPTICDPLLKNEVGVMEDDENTRKVIKEVMEDELNWQVKLVSNSKEAVDLVQGKQAAYFIFDNCIGSSKREGLKASKAVKENNPDSYVSILTEHPLLEDKRVADNLNVNYFRGKSANALGLRDNVKELAHDILNYQIKMITNFELKLLDTLKEDILKKESLANILEKLELLTCITYNKKNIIEKLESINKSKKPDTYEDDNITTYENLKLEKEWSLKYEGKYVAFVDGKLVDSNENEKELLEWLKHSEYRDEPIFFTKVEDRIIDLPSSLWLDDPEFQW